MKKIFSIIALMAAVMLVGTGCDKNEPSASATSQEGVLSGVFSVSETKQVQFSKGNLQYQASTKTWRFAENQWDVIGAANKNISSTYDGWIDLFGWGTGDNPTNRSQNDEDYATFTDWGVNAISNGGNTAKQWRTMTEEEWEYLCYYRTNSAHLWGQAMINTMRGLVFLPDVWMIPSGLSFTSFGDDDEEFEDDEEEHNYTMNVYTETEWKQMEDAGAVFLPCAGFREGMNVGYIGSGGIYWSSTSFAEDNEAGNVSYSDRGPGIMSNLKFLGFSVRLVQDVKE